MRPFPLIPAKAGTQPDLMTLMDDHRAHGVHMSARHLGPGLRRDARIGKGQFQ